MDYLEVARRTLARMHQATAAEGQGNAVIQHPVPVRKPAQAQPAAVPIPEIAQGRVRGQQEVRLAPVGDRDVCWHCHGSKSCDCAFCGAGGLDWRPGPCGACHGTGWLCWPVEVH